MVHSKIMLNLLQDACTISIIVRGPKFLEAPNSIELFRTSFRCFPFDSGGPGHTFEGAARSKVAAAALLCDRICTCMKCTDDQYLLAMLFVVSCGLLMLTLRRDPGKDCIRFVSYH